VPNSLLLIQGDGQSAQLGSIFPDALVLKVVDGANVGQAGQGVIFSVPGSGASGAFQPGDTSTYTTTSDSSGYVFANIKATGAAGAWLGLGQLTAALGVTRNWSQTNLPVAPSTVTITTGANLKAAINAAYGTLAATVRDGGSNPLPGITVQFSVPAGHGTFTGGVTTATAVTDGSGVATAPTFTANPTPGAFTVSVSVPIAAGVTTSTTWTNVDPAVPTTVQNLSGGGQQAPVSTDFAAVLQSRVTNGLGAPLSGVNVTFTAPASGQSCGFPSSITAIVATDVNGYAGSPLPHANALTGSYFVVASVAGATSAQFQLTNGASYLPEVCTTTAVPTGTAQFGSGIASWVNPNNALNATGSTVTIPSALDASKTLRCSPLNAALFTPIDDGAKITKWMATFDIKGTNGGGGQTSILSRIYNNTTNIAASFTDTTTTSFVAKSHTYAISGSMTGAQLKAGNVGIGFLSQLSVGDATVRNVKLSVCYQNPDVPAATLAVPLQLCEA